MPTPSRPAISAAVERAAQPSGDQGLGGAYAEGRNELSHCRQHTPVG